MLDYQEEFLQLSLQEQVISLGDFTLKSGRRSPYFFNAGLFNTGKAMSKLGQFYAKALVSSGVNFDILFGPAYKGIPLVTATVVALAQKHQRNVYWCFNRKEEKEHAEGGSIVGAKPQGKVVIIDDVITAGTAIRDVMNILQNFGATPSAILIALDRQEKGSGKLSATQQIEKDFNIPVISIIKLEHLLEFTLGNESIKQHAPAIANYRNQYGI
ncbi:MAG: orotate phosphoribosyltransferase [Candidatus Endonucleobacter bathymodioli]|uniref:Orotate phosphoribosyltransferase n=1 Tax=Candidatus Endonucleibacter bathymodioli TaxID=539814 RepID=A0AA90P1P2_9GAMM|nr:orotate phosphoribosyltransferase [Candidatus Endonucleobacter bathymodioli]